MADATAQPNPFPGMNPYLEQRWVGVHTRLITYLADLLARRLPAGLEAEPQERVFVETVGGPDRWVSPGVHVYRSKPTVRRPVDPSRASSGASAVAVPLLIDVPKVQVVEPYVEIIDAKSGGRVVTVIEIVSPSNKAAGAGRRKYLQKQREVRRSDANLVEIDLIRGGRLVTMARPSVVPPADATPYHVVVRRAGVADRLEYYRCPLREPLPTFPVPLRPGDDDLPVDLQGLVSQVFDNGLYGDKLDYGVPLVPPMNADDASWVAGIVAGPGPTAER